MRRLPAMHASPPAKANAGELSAICKAMLLLLKKQWRLPRAANGHLEPASLRGLWLLHRPSERGLPRPSPARDAAESALAFISSRCGYLPPTAEPAPRAARSCSARSEVRAPQEMTANVE